MISSASGTATFVHHGESLVGSREIGVGKGRPSCWSTLPPDPGQVPGTPPVSQVPGVAGVKIIQPLAKYLEWQGLKLYSHWPSAGVAGVKIIQPLAKYRSGRG